MEKFINLKLINVCSNERMNIETWLFEYDVSRRLCNVMLKDNKKGFLVF